jgi:hypothetical protein
LNHVSRTKPGIASCFTPKAGTYQEWTTSFAVVMMRIFLSTGTTSGLSTSCRYVVEIGSRPSVSARGVASVDRKLMPSPGPYT